MRGEKVIETLLARPYWSTPSASVGSRSRYDILVTGSLTASVEGAAVNNDVVTSAPASASFNATMAVAPNVVEAAGTGGTTAETGAQGVGEMLGLSALLVGAGAVLLLTRRRLAR
jgi:hypothetical protein